MILTHDILSGSQHGSIALHYIHHGYIHYPPMHVRGAMSQNIASLSFFRTTDWVTSKPLLGVAGLITVVMAMVSGFGLPMYLDLSWQPINMVAIFLTLGIGLDSVFLLLSSWTRSNNVVVFSGLLKPLFFNEHYSVGVD